jgi:hypothetical protein
MYIYVQALDIRLLDTLNYFSIPLSKIPSTFAIPNLVKGYFPHYWNRFTHHGTTRQGLPDMGFYNPDGMRSEAREKFVEWYAKHKYDYFDFDHELVKYCRSDVDILLKAVVRFRQIFMDVTSGNSSVSEVEREETLVRGEPAPVLQGIDPFQKCFTIASACNLVYRTKFLKKNTLGLIPQHGYNPTQKQSIKALQWLEYVMHSEGVHIRHARNGGELWIEGKRVDGYREDSETGQKYLYEYLGDFWHGCVEHYDSKTRNAVNNELMGDLYTKAQERKQFFKSKGYNYIEMWECHFDEQIKASPEIKQFVDSLKYDFPLDPRDALYGGRTNAIKLMHSIGLGEVIKYVDVKSLYPYVNKWGRYPLGHPDIITGQFKSLTEYEGLVKCTLLPPREIFLPPLPYRTGGKLTFPLCRSCVESTELIVGRCQHNAADRQLTATWCTEEVHLAMRLGYQVQSISEVWHWKKWSQYDKTRGEKGLFGEYIDLFFKLKEESSGFPDYCRTDQEKHQYVQAVYEHEGVLLNIENMHPNPGYRTIAKLCLNSFWGKFSQRNRMRQTEYIEDPYEYFKLLTDQDKTISNVQFISDRMVRLDYMMEKEFAEPLAQTNVAVAAITTSHARVELYKYLHQLGEKVLYCDTDSVIYLSRKGEEDQEPQIGHFMGDLTSELECSSVGCTKKEPHPEHYIVHFVSGGPKNYGYIVDNGFEVMKVKGITLNHRASNKVNFWTLKRMLTDKNAPDYVLVTEPNKICRDPTNMQIYTCSQTKKYRVVYTKRQVMPDGIRTLPFGF